MPVTTKPTAYINWVPDASSTNLAVPPSAISTVGYQPNQPLPAEYTNWLFHQLDQWVQYYDQSLASTVLATSLDASMRLVGGGTWSYSVTTGALAWSAPFSLAIPSAPESDNTAAAGQVTLTSGMLAYVQANLPFSTVGDLTQGDVTVRNLGYEIGISAGQTVVGQNIPAGTTVVSVSGSSAVLSAAPTAPGTGVALTFAGSGPLTVNTAQAATFIPNAQTVIIARAMDTACSVGVGGTDMWLRDLEQRSLLTAGYAITVQANAGQALGALQSVYISQGASDGRTQGSAYPCEAGATYGAARSVCIGFTHTATAAQAPCHIVQSGFLNGFSGLASGAIYYLNPATPGGITSTRPTASGQYVAPVGIAVSPSTLLVAIGPSAPVTTTFPFITVSPPTAGVAVQGNSAAGGNAWSITDAGIATFSGVASSAGFKTVIDMGSVWSQNYATPTPLQRVLYNSGSTNPGVAGTIQRKWIATHPGSIVGLSGLAYISTTDNGPPHLYVYKNGATFFTWGPPLSAGNTVTLWNTYTKGTYTFAAGDVFYCLWGSFMTTPNFQSDVQMTVELNS